jgi:hypothetical protein
MAKYAAIASVSKAEYDKLSDYDRVFTYAEYTDWSKTALIATEDGAMTPNDLIEDDRTAIIAYRPKYDTDIPKLLSDEKEELRTLYANDVRDQLNWLKELDNYSDSYNSTDKKSDVDDSEKYDTLFAVADQKVLNRSRWFFNQASFTNRDVIRLRLNGHPDYHPINRTRLNKKTTRYYYMANTPKWDNSSDIYDLMPSNKDSIQAQVYLGLHDRGIDPSKVAKEDLREMI